jgi:hypothetical protein
MPLVRELESAAETLRTALRLINRERGFLAMYIVPASLLFVLVFIFGNPLPLNVSIFASVMFQMSLVYFPATNFFVMFYLVFFLLLFASAVAGTAFKTNAYGTGGMRWRVAMAYGQKYIVLFLVTSLILVFVMSVLSWVVGIIVSLIFEPTGIWKMTVLDAAIPIRVNHIVVAAVSLYFLSRFAFYAPSLALENGKVGSIIRSWELTKKKAARNFTILAILFFIHFALLEISAYIDPVNGINIGRYLSIILLSPVFFVCMSLEYIDAVRPTTEHLSRDIERMVKKVSARIKKIKDATAVESLQQRLNAILEMGKSVSDVESEQVVQNELYGLRSDVDAEFAKSPTRMYGIIMEGVNGIKTLTKSVSYINYEPGFIALFAISGIAFYIFYSTLQGLIVDALVAPLFSIPILAKYLPLCVPVCVTDIAMKESAIAAIFILVSVSSVLFFAPAIIATVLKTEAFDRGGIYFRKALSLVGKRRIASLFVASFIFIIIIGVVWWALRILALESKMPDLAYSILVTLVTLYLVSRFAFYAQVCVLEGKSVGSIWRSWKLTKGRVTKLFSLVFMLFVLSAIISLILRSLIGTPTSYLGLNMVYHGMQLGSLMSYDSSMFATELRLYVLGQWLLLALHVVVLVIISTLFYISTTLLYLETQPPPLGVPQPPLGEPQPPTPVPEEVHIAVEGEAAA